MDENATSDDRRLVKEGMESEKLTYQRNRLETYEVMPTGNRSWDSSCPSTILLDHLSRSPLSFEERSTEQTSLVYIDIPIKHLHIACKVVQNYLF